MVLSRPGHIRRPGPAARPTGILPPMDEVDVECEGTVVEWRGPAPWYFVRIPEEESDDLKAAARGIEYWGQVPVVARIHDHEFVTALFPKDGVYLLPLKVAVRKATRVELDDVVTVALAVRRA